MKNNKFLFVFLVFVLILIAGYVLSIKVFKESKNASSASQNGEEKIQVTSSFYPLYFFANEIGGSRTDVKNITPFGAEPHDYEPTTKDIARIENSDLLILNGGIEPWADEVSDNLENKEVKIISAGDGLFTQEVFDEGETIADPHIWLDPRLATIEANKITETYISIDPSGSSYYLKNEKQLLDKLDALDHSYTEGLSNCKQKDIITSHAAFGYLASRYGLNQVTITGISPDEESSAKQLAEVADFARDNNVKYIFFETLVSPKLSETIANEIGARTLVLDPLEGLSEEDIRAGKDYFAVMEENLKNLQIALECEN